MPQKNGHHLVELKEITSTERELYEDVRDMLKGRTPRVAELWGKSHQYVSRQGERPYHPEDYPNGREHPSVVEQFWSFVMANLEDDPLATDVFWQRMNARYERARCGHRSFCVVRAFANSAAEDADVARVIFDHGASVDNKLLQIDEAIVAKQLLRTAVEKGKDPFDKDAA